MLDRTMRRGLVALAVAGLLVGACGDDDDSAEGASTTAAPGDDDDTGTTAAPEETTTTVELTGEPIVLMSIYEAGGASATPEVPEGAIAAAEAINRAGGIDGRPIEIVECDAGNDPNAAADCGRQAVDAGAVAVVGALSANSGEYMPILVENQIPALGNVPASAADFISDASFPIYGGLPSAAAGLAGALAEQGATTISVARVDLLAASAIAGLATAGLAGSGSSATVANDISIPAGAPDMATYVASTLEGGTDGVVVGLFGQDATNFMIQLRQTAPDVGIAATATDFAAVIEALGDAADGILVNEFFETDDSTEPAAQHYLDDLEAAGFDEPGGFRRNSYASVLVFAEIARTLPEITAPALYAALPTVEGIDVGLMPPVQFVTGGIGGIPRLFNACVQYAELQGGESTVFSDGFLNPFTGEPC